MGVEHLREYRREWLTRDLLAGLVLVGLLAPAGMAYAVAAGLPPVTGLYATIVPSLVYALVGPSRVMVVGPDSALAPLIAATVLPLAAGDPDTAVALAGALSIMAGLLCLGAATARLGFVSELLSTPVRYGYLHGIALTIIVAQIAAASGMSVSSENLVEGVRGVLAQIDDDAFHATSFAVGAVSLVVILVVRRLDRRIPAALVVVVGGVVAALAFDLGDRGVGMVGDMPTGLPLPRVPDVGWDTIKLLLGAAVGVALVSFADTSVLSRTMAMRRREPVDANRELAALGAVNIAAGLFQGFAVSASNSRTPVAESSGARSQIASASAAIVLLVLVVGVPSTFRHLPDATLAAIVLAAAVSLLDIGALRRLWSMRRSEFLLAVAGLLAVAVFGPVNGVVIAVVLSLLNFVRRAWTPHTAELVRVDGLKGYHERARHPEGRVIPGLLLYRFDAPLFFANARFFVEDVERRVAERRAAGEAVQCVIVTAEPITDIDTSAADALRTLVSDLDRDGIDLRFAELKGVVRDRLERYGMEVPRLLHTERTTGEAVRRYVADHAVEWTDWEDR